MPEYFRQMPESGQHFDIAPSWWKKTRLDFWLFLLLMSLSAYGFVMLFSATDQSSSHLVRQGIYWCIGFVAMCVIARLDLKTICLVSPWIFLIGVIMLALVPLIGVSVNGSQRWLDLGILRFQPSELMKFATPILLSYYFSRQQSPPTLRVIVTALAIVAVPFFLILRQPDLGTSLLVAISGLFVVWLAGLRWRYILLAVVAAVSALIPIWRFVLHDYQKQRVLTLLDPEADRLGAGWNIIQSITAIGSGGIRGKGYMGGTQSQLDFLPESHTDFIIAVLAEEFGFVGVMGLLLLYLGVLSRGTYIALKSQNLFGQYVVGSLCFTFFVYVIVNMGMVAGVLPIVGVPLPFISYGGTALVSMFISFGVVMAVATSSNR